VDMPASAGDGWIFIVILGSWAGGIIPKRRGGRSNTSLGGSPGHLPNTVSGQSFSRSDHGVFCGS
jgi:hypothetical protein